MDKLLTKYYVKRSNLQNQKFFVEPSDELKAINKLVYETKKDNGEELCFTIEKCGSKNKNSVYCAEIADDESTTEYYYLHPDALEDFDENIDNEQIFRVLLLGELDPLEALKMI